jgi:twinkle protein
MTVIELAEKHLGEYKQRGEELNIKTCPFCGRDKWKFYLNSVTGKYKCFSGSCNAGGEFVRLEEKFGVKLKLEERKKENKTNIVKINENDFTFKSKTMLDYAEKRGISKETLIECRVLWSKKNKAMTFFITEGLEEKPDEEGKNGKANIVGIKYRTTDKKIWAERGSKLCLIGWDLIDNKEDTVYITEGEFDWMTLKELGYKNSVTVPSGTSNFDWIEYNQDWLKNKNIILCFDGDDAGKKATKKAVEKIECKSIKYVNFNTGYKDANDVLINQGVITLTEILENASELKSEGIRDITDIGRFNINDIERFKTGVTTLDYCIRGLKETELIVVAGENGSGKTTLVSQIILNALEQNKNTFVYNGELGEEMWKDWLMLQASCGEGIETRKDEMIGVVDYYVSDDKYNQINNWIKGKLFVNTSKKKSDPKDIINSIKNAYKKNNCFLFVLDNLSTINFLGDRQKHELLGEFVVELKELAKEYNICILVVNHLIKSEGKPSKDKIKGSGIVSDISDTVLLVEKGKIHISKNRFYGILLDFETEFCKKTKRIFDSNYAQSESNKKINYTEGFIWIEEELPF